MKINLKDIPQTVRVLDSILNGGIEYENFEETVQSTGELPENHIWYVAMLAEIELTGKVKYGGKVAKDKAKLDQLIKKSFNLEEE